MTQGEGSVGGRGGDSVLCFVKAGDPSGPGGTRAEGAAGPARPSPLTVCRGQVYVRSLLIRTRGEKKIKFKTKKKKSNRSLTESTENKQSNPESKVFPWFYS